MEKFRWFTLFIGALVLGGFTYTLIGQDKMVKAGAIAWMFLMTAWFIWKDLEVDSYKP